MSWQQDERKEVMPPSINKGCFNCSAPVVYNDNNYCKNDHVFCIDCLFGISEHSLSLRECKDCRNFAKEICDKRILQKKIDDENLLEKKKHYSSCYLCKQKLDYYSYLCINDHGICRECQNESKIDSIKELNCEPCTNLANKLEENIIQGQGKNLKSQYENSEICDELTNNYANNIGCESIKSYNNQEKHNQNIIQGQGKDLKCQYENNEIHDELTSNYASCGTVKSYNNRNKDNQNEEQLSIGLTDEKRDIKEPEIDSNLEPNKIALCCSYCKRILEINASICKRKHGYCEKCIDYMKEQIIKNCSECRDFLQIINDEKMKKNIRIKDDFSSQNIEKKYNEDNIYINHVDYKNIIKEEDAPSLQFEKSGDYIVQQDLDNQIINKNELKIDDYLIPKPEENSSLDSCIYKDELCKLRMNASVEEEEKIQDGQDKDCSEIKITNLPLEDKDEPSKEIKQLTDDFSSQNIEKKYHEDNIDLNPIDDTTDHKNIIKEDISRLQFEKGDHIALQQSLDNQINNENERKIDDYSIPKHGVIFSFDNPDIYVDKLRGLGIKESVEEEKEEKEIQDKKSIDFNGDCNEKQDLILQEESNGLVNKTCVKCSASGNNPKYTCQNQHFICESCCFSSGEYEIHNITKCDDCFDLIVSLQSSVEDLNVLQENHADVPGKPFQQCIKCNKTDSNPNYTCQNQHFICESCWLSTGENEIYAIHSCNFCYYLVIDLKKTNLSIVDPNILPANQGVILNNAIPTTINCEVCSTPYDKSYAQCHNGFFFCDSCLKNIEHTVITNKCMCDYCFSLVREIKKQRQAGGDITSISNKIIQQPHNEIILEVSCSTCKSNSDVAFLCNHNLCNNCILNESFHVIKSFAVLVYDHVITEIPEKFALHCPVISCKSKIRMPFIILYYILQKYLSQYELYILHAFIPYFDGIRCKFVVCRCNNTVGLVNNLRLNCACQ